MNSSFLFKLLLFTYFCALNKLVAADGMPQFNVNTFPSQLFWLIITFSILYFIVLFILLPRIRENIRLRKNKISNDLERAERIKNEVESMIQTYELKINEAKNKANDILKKSIKKQSADYSSQINLIKKQIENKLLETEKKLEDYKAEMEKGIIKSAVLVSTEIISKIMFKDKTKDEIKSLLENYNIKRVNQ